MTPASLPETIGLILHFRHAFDTVKCIDSLAREGIKHVMLVDNSEDTGASLKIVLEKITTYAISVSIYEPERNLGFAAGINRGLAEIRTRHGRACVLLINNDARLRKGAHIKLRQALVDGACLATPRMCLSNGHYIDSVFYHRASGLLFHQHWPGSYEYLSGCCMLIDSSLLNTPLFDEDFFFYGEDAELGWRLQRGDVAQCKVPESIVDHDVSLGSKNGSMFYEYHMIRAHWLLARKLASGRLSYTVNLLGRAFFLPLRIMLRSIRQGSFTPLKAGLMATMDAFNGDCRMLTPQADSLHDGAKAKLYSP